MYQLLGLAGIIIFGYLIANAISDKFNLPLKVGLSFLFGSSLFTLIIYITHLLLKIKFTAANSSAQLITLILLVLLVNIRLKRKLFTFVRIRLSKIEMIIWAVFTLLFAGSIFHNLNWPVLDWDAITLYDLRAKIILNTGTVADIESYFHPLMTSLLHYWFYVTGWLSPMPIYTFFYVSFALVVYGLFKENINQKYALLGSFAAMSTPALYKYAQIAYLNMPYCAYILTGSVLIYLSQKQKDKAYLISGLLITGLSVWLRMGEPYWLILLATIPLTKLGVKTYTNHTKLITLLVVLGIIIYLYIVSFNTLFKTLSFLKWSLFEYYSSYFLLAVLLTVVNLRNSKQSHFWPILFWGYTIFTILGVGFMVSKLPVWLELPDTIRRVTMFLPPLVLVWAVFDLSLHLERSKHETK